MPAWLKKFICMFAVVQIVFLSITSTFQVKTYAVLESYYFFQSILESYLFNSVRSSFSDNEELITTTVDDVVDEIAGEQAKE